MKTLFLITLISIFLSPALYAIEPNDTWGNASAVGPSLQVSDQIDFTTYGPDTVLGLFDEFGNLTAVDDDSSFFGNGFASGILQEPINTDGSINIAVTGFGDFDLDGEMDDFLVPHSASGYFEAYVTIYDDQQQALDSIDLSETLVSGEVITFDSLADSAWIGGSYDVEINNFFGPPSDVDFWSYSNLPAGSPFTAEITSAEFDTLLGLYDDLGNLIDADDQSGVAPLSLLEGIVPNGGQLFFAVTGYPDFSFSGSHSQAGTYTLSLALDPSFLPGDYNANGIVDAADYTVWRDNVGGASDTLANNIHSGIVGQSAYDTWVANYGESLPSSISRSIPEPASRLLITIFLLWIQHRCVRTNRLV